MRKILYFILIIWLLSVLFAPCAAKAESNHKSITHSKEK